MSAIRKRRIAIRLLLVAALVGVAFLMYNIGREYKVLLDNETVAVDGTEYPAVPYAELTIDGNENKKTEIFADDRIVEKMVGSRHSLMLTIMNEDDGKVIRTVERTFKLNVDTRKWMISLAAVAGGAENIFVPNPLADEDEEEASETEPSPVEETPESQPEMTPMGE